MTDWLKDSDGHWQICNCDSEINYSAHESDTWISENDHHRKICDTCEQEFAQGECYGGYATCTEKAVCHECGNDYGELLPHDYDGDCDKECNNCDEGSRTNTSAHSYQNTCDKTCDICREARSVTHTFANDCDDTCDICFTKRSVSGHKGGTVSCEKPAVCSSCGAEYGSKGDHVFSAGWTYNAIVHWHECSCGAKSEEADHTFGEVVDGKKSCSCGYTVAVNSPVANSEESKKYDALVTTSIVLGGVSAVSSIGIILWVVFSKKRIF